jgi:hypothetical protein
MWLRSFADEEIADDENVLPEDEASETKAPDYNFAGFTVDFSEKIMLTRVGINAKGPVSELGKREALT